jgi:hypothetical protein
VLALGEIMGEDSPKIPKKYYGMMGEIAKIWLKWGRKRKFI